MLRAGGSRGKVPKRRGGCLAHGLAQEGREVWFARSEHEHEHANEYEHANDHEHAQAQAHEEPAGMGLHHLGPRPRCYLPSMTQATKGRRGQTVHEALREEIDGLPEPLAREALDFILFVKSRHAEELVQPKGSLTEFLASSPLAGSELESERPEDRGRAGD